MITLAAPAKLNLYLHVTGKRTDGYHLLDSLVTFLPDLYDTIQIEQSDSLSFRVDGKIPVDAQGIGNIAVKAALSLGRLANQTPNVRISLHKNIPAGAGLGGGSADAAAVIKGLEQLWNLSLTKDERTDLLLSLGADVPVCYHAKPCRFEGVGEIISDIPALPRFSLLLVWPDCHTATKDVFKARVPDFKQRRTDIPDSFNSLDSFIGFLNQTGNDLQVAAQKISPAIYKAYTLIESQKGCRLARMSGSGSCVFGIFEDSMLCQAAQAALKSDHPAWWAHTSAV